MIFERLIREILAEAVNKEIKRLGMYSIPKEVNIAALKNDTVSQISFGLNYILLSFNRASIQFSGSFSFAFSGKKYEKTEVCPVEQDYGLLQLLEKRIVDVSCNEERTDLLIEFEDNRILHLKSDMMYESFEIHLDNERIVI